MRTRRGPTGKEGGSQVLLVLLVSLLVLEGCPQGRPIDVVVVPSPGGGPDVALVGSRVEGDTWAVVVEAAGDGDVPLRLDGLPVRGCARHDRRIACRFPGLSAGDHLLEAGSGRRRVTAWARVGPRDWRQAVLYLVIPDRFRDGDPSNNRDVDAGNPGAFHGGDLAGLRASLDYLADLSVSALWITPVVDQIDHPVAGAGFPHFGFHGYWAENFEVLEPRLGSEADLAGLVADAHARGIAVLLDVVLNHPGYGAPYVFRPGWTRSVEAGTCPEDAEATDLTRCLHGLPDFRTEIPEVRDYLVGAHVRWLRASLADGFRVDAARHVEVDLLARLAREARSVRSGAFLIGEVWGADPLGAGSGPASDPAGSTGDASPYLKEAGLDGLFDFSFSGHALGFVTGRERAVALAAYLERREAALRAPAASPDRPPPVWAHFLDTHDTEGFLHRTGGDASLHRLAAVLQMTVAGMPVVYYGDEVGRPGGEWPENRSDMPPETAWDRDTLRLYRTLIRTRRLHPALPLGRYRTLQAEGDLLVFLKVLEEPARGVVDLALVALNRGDTPVTSAFDLTGELTRCPPLRDALAEGASVDLDTPVVRLSVPARGARLLVTEE